MKPARRNTGGGKPTQLRALKGARGGAVVGKNFKKNVEKCQFGKKNAGKKKKKRGAKTKHEKGRKPAGPGRKAKR